MMPIQFENHLAYIGNSNVRDIFTDGIRLI